MGVFGAVFWCRPENTIFLVVWENNIKKCNNHTSDIYGGFGASVRAPFLMIFRDFVWFFFWFPFHGLLVVCSSSLFSYSSNFCLCCVSSFFLFPFPSSSFFFFFIFFFKISCSLVSSFFSLSPSSCYSSS